MNKFVSMNARGGVVSESDYVSDLIGWTILYGFLNVRLFWNHQEVSSSISVAGVPGQTYTNNVNTANNPRDRANLSVGYANDGFSVTVSEQFIGQQNWFGSTSPNTVRYVVDPPIPAYWLTGLAVTKDFVVEEQQATVFLNINNLFDNNGPITGGFNGSPGMLYPTPTYADIIGRYFTVGLRVKM